MERPRMQPAAPAAGSALLDVVETIDFEPVFGEGAYLFSKTGQRFVDFYGGHAVAVLGYGHTKLLEALERQSRSLLFQSSLVRMEVRDRAAAKLAAFAPQGLSKVFFVNSGAEANENALRVACRLTQRAKVVALEGSFHGRTAAAAAVTAGSARWDGFPHRPFSVEFVPFDDVSALDVAVDADTAAIILEPVQGMAGARALSVEFMQAARAKSAAHGALLILDEVQCGIGRSGHPFAAQAYGVLPDLLTTAKGLAGGFPAGALLLRDEIASCVGRGDLGSTFGGGPLACALIEAVIDVIREENLLSHVRRMSARLHSECRVGPVMNVQGMGLLVGLRTRRPAKDVLTELRQRAILAGSSADPNVVRLLPPLIIDDPHVDALVSALKEIPA